MRIRCRPYDRDAKGTHRSSHDECLVAKFACRIPQTGSRLPNPKVYLREKLAFNLSTESASSRFFSQALFYMENPSGCGFAFVVRLSWTPIAPALPSLV
jgi:hypothetical protein